MTKKILISRNLSDRKSREWWAAIDELAAKAPQIGSSRQPFGQPTAERSGTRGAKTKSPVESHWLPDPLPALLRARKRAEEVARQTGTALVIFENGRLVYVHPRQKTPVADERSRRRKRRVAREKRPT